MSAYLSVHESQNERSYHNAQCMHMTSCNLIGRHDSKRVYTIIFTTILFPRKDGERFNGRSLTFEDRE